MGQLEKYGLYVMCLVIFLILGVTLWGEPANASRTEARREGASQVATIGDLGGVTRTGAAPARSGGGNLRELLTQADNPPRYEPTTTSGSGSVADLVGGAVEPEPEPEVAVREEAQPAPAPKVERRRYTIRKNDTLGKIAQRELGSTRHWPVIERLNPGVDANRLPLGKEIVLPTQAELGGSAEPSSSGRAAGAYRTYKIRKGDTFTRIAATQLRSSKRELELRQLNPNVNPRNLRIGSTIKMPLQ